MVKIVHKYHAITRYFKHLNKIYILYTVFNIFI